MAEPTSLSLFYFPTAFVLGALHALEPGHAKTLTASFLIGIKGTRFDALVLGLSVAVTHSLVVIAICLTAMYLGQKTVGPELIHSLEIVCSIAVILLGSWMLFKRLRRHNHDDHCAHDHKIPIPTAERPSVWQIMTFGAAGGLIPCPASITVMLLALGTSQIGLGILSLVGFGLGLSVTLVTVGWIAVTTLQHFTKSKRFEWISQNAPAISSAFVILSGVAALVFALI